jgi:selenocysteine-specific elongation factor
VALRGDRYIIRSYSPQVTIGGGIVLDGYPEKFRRKHRDHAPLLLEMERSKGTDALLLILRGKRPHLRSLKDLSVLANLSSARTEKHLRELESSGTVLRAKTRFIHREVIERWEVEIRTEIDRYFEANPYKMEVPVSALKSALRKRVEPDGLDLALSRLESRGDLDVSGDRVRVRGRTLEMEEEDRALSSELSSLYRKSPFTPPSLEEAAQALKRRPEELRNIFTALVSTGELVEVRKGLIFHRTAVERARESILSHFQGNPDLTVSEFRKALETTRKYALPLLDYFDGKGLTRRVGDKRIRGRG